MSLKKVLKKKLKRYIALALSLVSKKQVTVKIMGGLGNQLFQIAAVLHYAKKFNRTPVFTNKKQLHTREGDVGGYTYWDIFNTTNLLNLEEINNIKFIDYKEPTYNYLPFKNSIWNVMLQGYFQSPKYVDYVKDEMLAVLWSNSLITEKIENEYQKIIKAFGTEELLSVHIRRGDYLKLSTIHTNLTFEYYEEALSHFSNEIPLIIFSNDQDWCKKELQKRVSNPLYFVTDNDYVEILLMSKIKNNIIANSSFSWWSAYLNQQEDKKVVAPKEWFGIDWKGRNGVRDWSGIYEENWIRI